MALSAARNTPQMGDDAAIDTVSVKVKGSTTCYKGGMACIDAGYAKPAAGAAGLQILGRFEETVDNSAGSSGDKEVKIRMGVFKWANSASTDDVAQADIGKLCYAVDDATVAKTDNSGARSPAGVVVRYESDGIWVASGYSREAAAGFEETGEVRGVIPLKLTLVGIADGTVVNAITPGFAGRIKKIQFVVDVPATTAAKLTTLTTKIGSTNVTGGVVALTSANCTPMGNVVSGTAVTAANIFTATDTISVVASSTTAFVEGSGTLLIFIG